MIMVLFIFRWLVVALCFLTIITLYSVVSSILERCVVHECSCLRCPPVTFEHLHLLLHISVPVHERLFFFVGARWCVVKLEQMKRRKKNTQDSISY